MMMSIMETIESIWPIHIIDSVWSISILVICFGTILATEDSGIVHNDYGGFLLRTKFSGVDEGGVASGFATLSSPYLC
jgi:hypothetical protein